MADNNFRRILHAAVSGDHEALEIIFYMYEYLIKKHSYVDGKFDEDLHQYILIRIALKISKFDI